MSFCSFTKDFTKNSTTNVSNVFINDYLADADGVAVKVYLYGLFVCENSAEDISIESFAKNLYMSVEDVRDCFMFWEEYGIVSVISEQPFTVKYLSLAKTGKPRKFKPEKYTEFNKAIQTLITERMISTNEYSEYFSIMEDYSIKPEAMLMIVKYCVDLKGPNIGFRYIQTVARDFAERNVITIEAIENELCEYMSSVSDIQRILTALSIKRKPDIEDNKLYNKWVQDMQFAIEPIIFAVKKAKIKKMEKLDALILELYNNKCFGEKEIEDYLNRKTEIQETAIAIANQLSVYCEVLSPYIENYVSPWMSKGYESETLIKIAGFCFKNRKKSFESMNDFINKLFKDGLISLESIAIYLKKISIEDEFIKQLLSYANSDRRPTKWDRENLSVWREWGFSDEMLIEASKLSSNKNNPINYMQIILSNWKAQNVFTPDKINSVKSTSDAFTAPIFGTERTYTKEEFDNFFDNIEEMDI